MKISFIQPNVGFKGHTWEALGIGYLASMVRDKYPSVEMDFYSGFYEKDGYILQGARDSDVVCFSCTSPQYKHALRLASRLKELNDNLVTVFGGAHPSALPDLVASDTQVDIVVQGEGELPMLDVVAYDGHPNTKIYSHMQIQDINTIPFPDRRLIKNSRNIWQAQSDTGKRIASILSSRGCPFDCSFCSSSAIWPCVRLRSASNILAEMEQVVNEFNLDFVKFADDTFTVSKNRVNEFCLNKRWSGLDVPFGANAHINSVDEKMLFHLARAGCEELWFGVESGSPRIRSTMNKHFSNDRVRAIFAFAKERGIKTRAYFLLGMPDETIDDIKATERLCDEIRPDFVGFTLLAPYPGSAHYDDSVEDWSTFDEYNNTWVKTKTLSNEQLRAEQQRLVDKYQDKAVFRQKVV